MADWAIKHTAQSKLTAAKARYREVEGWRDTLPRDILSRDLAGMVPTVPTGGKRTSRKRRRKLAQTSKRANRH